MDNGRIDVLIPTAGKRVDGLIYQINAFINQSYEFRTIWVLIDVESFDEFNILKKKIDAETKRYAPVKMMHVPDEYRGKHGHGPIKYAVEKLPLEGDWIITSGDDDSVMPWALEKLIEASDGVDMVVGRVVPVKRNHEYLENHVLGYNMLHGHITGSCCLYRASRLKELGYDDSRYDADWDMIEKMMEYRYKRINTVLFVMPQSFE
jgi:hypothetical protein